VSAAVPRAWVGGLPTCDRHHPTRAARTARLMPTAAPSPARSFVDDCLVLAATNKCLAKSNKSRPPSKATKRRNKSASVWKPRTGLRGVGQAALICSCAAQSFFW